MVQWEKMLAVESGNPELNPAEPQTKDRENLLA